MLHSAYQSQRIRGLAKETRLAAALPIGWFGLFELGHLPWFQSFDPEFIPSYTIL